MNITILGAGHVGAALGMRLAARGYSIFYGVPDDKHPKYSDLKKSIKATFYKPSRAVMQSKIVILATPWSKAREVLTECGPLDHKILVDCTNPIKADFSGLEVGHTTSGAEMIAAWAKGAKVVKCFNQTGSDNMANPNYGSQKLIMFAAGDDEDAVRITADLARDVGFEVVELSGLSRARQLEQLAWLWIDGAHKQGLGRDYAFAMLRRS